MKTCTCYQTPYKTIQGSHHCQMCSMFKRRATGWSQDLRLGKTKFPFFNLRIQQCGVSQVRLQLLPVLVGDQVGYQSSIQVIKNRQYGPHTQSRQRQHDIEAEAQEWIVVVAEQELTAHGWSKRELIPSGQAYWVPPNSKGSGN